MSDREAFSQYRRTNIAEMRPYVHGEDLSRVSVSKTDDPESDMGMVARNPQNHADQWYVARKYFDDNFEPLQAALQHTGQGEVPFDFAQPVLEPYYAGRILSVIAESTPQPAVPEGYMLVPMEDLKAIKDARKNGFDVTYMEHYLDDLLSADKED
jgi:hypothetical protein